MAEVEQNTGYHRCLTNALPSEPCSSTLACFCSAGWKLTFLSLSQLPPSVVHFVTGTGVLQSTVLASAPHPVSYQVCPLFPCTCPSLLSLGFTLSVSMSGSDLPLIPQIPRPAPALAQKPTACPLPCAHRMGFHLLLQASQPHMTRGYHFPSVLPPPCPPYTRAGPAPARVAPLHLGTCCPHWENPLQS